MSSSHASSLHLPSSRSPPCETVVYVSFGCSVDSLASLDQQLPRGLETYFSNEGKKAKLWLFDPKFWNTLPLCLRRPSALQHPTTGAKECIRDLDDHYTQVERNLYARGSLQIEVCPFYFERAASFFLPFTSYLNQVLSDGGHVYLSVFTQPYLLVEENTDIIDMYHELIKNIEESHPDAISRLHYHHLANYGSNVEEADTLVWKLEPGQRHNQDEALIREVSRFPGESPTFGCGCYLAFPGSLFSVNRLDSGHDYRGLHSQVKAEIEKRGGPTRVLQSPSDILLRDLSFP